mmetsp:Transcript_12960/g.26976  ORF Transcript_12960/g.26976 Transcript_12960/m.26976 type:complete len:203 (+) Transcript_12960:513-1121(+)
MAETGFRCRRRSATSSAVSRPPAIQVPPPADNCRVATLAASFPSLSMRRSLRGRSEEWLKVTMLRRSCGRLSLMTKRTASWTRRILSPVMEPLTSKTQMRSSGWRGSVVARAEVDAFACKVTMPKMSCARPRGSALYSMRASIDKGPEPLTSGSGWAWEGAPTCAAGAMESSSAKAEKSGEAELKRRFALCCCQLLFRPPGD